jgi:hypothetical protein
MGKKRLKFTKNTKSNTTKKIRVKTIYKKVLEYQNGDFFEVERIIDRKGTDENPIYNIKWKGWGDETNTWEPASHLKNVKHLVYQFEKSKNPDKNLDFLDRYFDDSSPPEYDSEDSDGDIKRDIPERIVKMFEDDYKNVWAEIKWHIRVKNGLAPNNTVVLRDTLKEKYILLLIDYYESKIKLFK